jgi:YD repeat-containing protein
MSLGAMRADSPGWTGFQLTTGAQPLTVTALGRLCSPGNSLLHELRLIRTSDNVLLATTSVSMSGCTSGQFKYADLPSPVTLSANTAYVMVSYEAGGDLFHDWTGTWLTTASVATVNGAVYTINGGQSWSLATGNGNSYVPVDFKYTSGTPSISFVTGRVVGAMRADSPGWAGFKMTTAAQAVTVTSLGRLCLPGNSQSHSMKVIRSSDNATVATTSVAMSGCTQGQFKYAQLASPVTLAANTGYMVVSYEVGSDLFHDWTGTAVSTTSVATVNSGIYTPDGGQTWGPAGGTSSTYVPVDFKYQTDEQGVGTGLTAKYYDNTDFTAYKMTRSDPVINFDWGSGAPSASMGADQFSVRWTGMVSPRFSQTYTFYTTTDDGVRLWVDRTLVIDKWIDQAQTQWSGEVTLEAGRLYDIRMEFYENFGGASAKLEWQSASQAREVVPQSRLYGCWKGIDQFVKDFYQAALARQPNQTELQEWSGRLAQAQGESQLAETARTLGYTVFDLSPSSAYTARNRSDGDFVADLYRGYLQRDPDQAGWDYWKNQVPVVGRANVREAFAQSTEFYEKVGRLCGTSAAADANGGTGYNFSSARLDPDNRTGGGGADPLSRNFNFSVPLLSLPGRAGLDLGLSLSYNSLVWTKDSTGVTFDADEGFPGPGFRLGFPVIQPRFYNPQIQQQGQPARYSYLLVTPSGGHVELRQVVGTTGVYESADSSYLQLTEIGGALTLVSTDGTRLSFYLLNGEYRCYEVKDRNGNYISVGYYSDGRIDKVTDTLGRAITFNYDAFQNISSITQPWKRETEASPNGVDETHTWATFGYTNLTLQPSFSSLAVMGEQPGSVIPFVSQVGLDDGSYYKFEYNGWGQVWKVTYYAADSRDAQGQPNDTHALSSTWLDLSGAGMSAGGAGPVPATPQTDCPRFSQQRTWVENGVMNQSAEVTTSYSAWTPAMASCDITPPDPTPTDTSDNVVYKEIYATTGWQRGLTTSSKVMVNGVQRKWTDITWSQDNTNADYPINPRVTNTTINDSEGHHRGTSVTYQSFTPPVGGAIALPQDVLEYETSATTPIRTTRTEYNLSTEYTSRRIIGLPNFQYLYEGSSVSGTLNSKVGYVYDDDMLTNYLQALPSAATQHDVVNYGMALRWRGNVNRVRRYDVTGGASTFVESQAGYNVAGAVAFSKDAAGHQATVNYTDSFYQGVNRSIPALQSFAYPTTVTDPDNFSATTVYNYDMGAATQTTDPKSAIVKSRYDSAGRAERVTRRDGVNGVDKGYARMVYPASMNLVQSFAQLDVGVEAYSASILDGAGRVRASARDLPGSTGGFAGQFFDYDAVGRLARQSNPTETTAAGTWPATGDDTSAGWLYTTQTFDWKGRPLVTTLPKLNPGDPNEQPVIREAIYGGCGCAGGEVATLTDEGTRFSDGTLHRRQQRVTSDVLGRPVKAETLNWDGTVYSATTTEYNVRDQVEAVKVYQGQATTDGSCPVGTCQLTTNTYDGHGRAWKTRAPSQTADSVVTYNPDDTLNVVTDPRGAMTTYSYNNNNRGLVTGVTSTLAGGTNAPPVTFGYDSAGNRISMTDGLGGVTYGYDTLSRLTSETRNFTDTTPVLNASFTLNYDYYLSDALKTYNDTTGTSLAYGYDQAGQLESLTGGGTSYVTSADYRAWGAAKQINYGNTKQLTVSYNTRLQMTRTTVAGVLDRSYEYHDDGRVKYAHDFTDNKLDRSFFYDHVGRISGAFTGFEARTGGQQSEGYGPYRQTYSYDTWGNLTGRSWRSWTQNQFGTFPTTQSYSAVYTNNKNTNNNGTGTGWVYDASGMMTQSTSGSATFGYTYDASGQMRVSTSPGRTYQQAYDGDGRVIKSAEGSTPTYYVHSSVLGGQVAFEVNGSGTKLRGYVYAGGQLIAKQEGSQVLWDYRDATNTSSRLASASGAVTSKVETDPLGTKVDDEWSQWGSGTTFNSSPNGFYGDPRMPDMGCTIDRHPASCEQVQRAMNAGAAVPCPPGGCGPQWDQNANRGQGGFVTFRAFADGYEGFLQLNSSYRGSGLVMDMSEEMHFLRRSSNNTGPNSNLSPQNPTGPWVDPSTVGEAPPLPNPNCIEKAVPGGKGKLSTRGLWEAISATTGKPVRTNLPGHNGQHVLIALGTKEPFIALPPMAGAVLHAGHQSKLGSAGYIYAMVDILLDRKIDGQQYVMTLTDHFYDGAKLSGRVRPGDQLGIIRGSDNRLNESGMHVTLMPYSVWKKFIYDKKFAPGSRDKVPFNALMGAGTDPRSPFKCP